MEIEKHRNEAVELPATFSKELELHALDVAQQAIDAGAKASSKDWLYNKLENWDAHIADLHHQLMKQGIPIDGKQRKLDNFRKQQYELYSK